MLRAVLVLLAVSLLAHPLLAEAEPPKLALRGEGYLGYANIDIANVEADAFQGGGTATASAVFGQFYTQLDVFGNRAEFDLDSSVSTIDAESVGLAGRVGWRDAERGSFGLVGVYDYLEFGPADSHLGRVGAEGELFLDRVTLALNVGDLQDDGSASIYLDGNVSFYPTERIRLDAGAGAISLEDDDPNVIASAGGEALILDLLSAFVRWEGSFLDAGFVEFEQHSIVVGARVYWGAETPSLVAYDRQHFKRSCAGFLIAGRVC